MWMLLQSGVKESGRWSDSADVIKASRAFIRNSNFVRGNGDSEAEVVKTFFSFFFRGAGTTWDCVEEFSEQREEI